MSKFELLVSDFDPGFIKDYESRYGFYVVLERKGLRPALTPYYLWIFAVVIGDKVIDSGPFRWSLAISEPLTDEEAADIIADFYAGTTIVKNMRNS